MYISLVDKTLSVLADEPWPTSLSLGLNISCCTGENIQFEKRIVSISDHEGYFGVSYSNTDTHDKASQGTYWQTRDWES